MHLSGSLIFLLMACFDKVGRGGLRPFFDWVAESCESSSLWKTQSTQIGVTPNLLVGLEYFIQIIPLIEPKVYLLGAVHQKPILAYSDAEWTALHPPFLPRRGLGGCILKENDYYACSIDTPLNVLFNLAPRNTQIIPLELIAAAGLLYTYKHIVGGKDLVFFIDNQSVCGALTKGTSKSRDLQFLTTAWHVMCQHLHCRVWIEWVPSAANPADILSRQHCSEPEITEQVQGVNEYCEMILPAWSDMGVYDTLDKIIASLRSPPGNPSGI